MVTLDQSVQPHPEVVDTELEAGDTVLLHLAHTTYYSLNSTGTCIWQGLKQGLSLRDVSQRLQERFAVAAEHADRSVLTFVHELAQHQLVDVSES
jgi:Coenzyme PQQ synthesis protein D (PqqD)